MQVLHGLWRTLREDQLVEALHARFRAAFRNGLVLYLLALLFLSVALLAGRLVFSEFMMYHEDLRRELNATLQGQHEPGRDDKYFGVVAALLRGVNSEEEKDPSRLCPQSQMGCQRVEGFLRTFQALSEIALGKELLEAWSTEKVVERVLSKVQLKNLPLRTSIREWSKNAADSLVDYRNWEKSLPPVPCEGQYTSQAPADVHQHDDDFGPALCEGKDEQSTLTRLLIPSLENLAANGETVRVKPRVMRAYWLSRLMDSSLGLVIPDVCQVSETEDYAFVQAYFISPDNLLRIWQCKTESRVSLHLFPWTRTWTSVSYFQALLKSEKSYYDTASYIDYGGFGLIRTRCERVVHEGTLLGVACADYKVPNHFFNQTLANSRLLRVDQLDGVITEHDRFTLASVSTWQLAEDGTVARHKKGDEERHRALVDAFNQQLSGEKARTGKGSEALLRALGQRISLLSLVEGSSSFFVPLGIASDRRIKGLLVTPQVEYPDVWGAALVCLVCLGCSALLVVMGQTRARREGEAETVTDLLKNLEVGILIVNEHEEVEAANDRAEDILGVLLPKIGRLQVDRGLRPQLLLGEEGVQQRFLDLIEPHIVRVDSWGRPRERAERYQDTIPELRRDNDSSTYYAKLRMGLNTTRWIRISAAPITLMRRFSPLRRGMALPRTFGLVALVRKGGDTHVALERAWNNTPEMKNPSGVEGRAG